MTTICDDAVPFDWLYADSKKYQLSDLDFLEYIKMFVIELLKNGGKVVYGGKDTGYDWIETKDFGTIPTEIAINLLKGLDKQNITDNTKYLFTYNVWFAKPDAEFPMYLKQLS